MAAPARCQLGYPRPQALSAALNSSGRLSSFASSSSQNGRWSRERSDPFQFHTRACGTDQRVALVSKFFHPRSHPPKFKGGPSWGGISPGLGDPATRPKTIVSRFVCLRDQLRCAGKTLNAGSRFRRPERPGIEVGQCRLRNADARWFDVATRPAMDCRPVCTPTLPHSVESMV
jgi:hypothetical protein